MNQLNHSEAAQAAFIYLTVNQLCDEYPAFKKGGVRALIFNEHENGLAESGAIVRVGRKILIHVPKWFGWVESQGGK